MVHGIFIERGMTVLYKTLLGKCEFHADCVSHALYKDTNENFYPYFPYFLTCLSKIQYKMSAHNNVGRL
jgi:hypothetical protein